MLSANRPDRHGFNDSRALASTYTRHPRPNYACLRYGFTSRGAIRPGRCKCSARVRAWRDPRVRARPDPQVRAWGMPGARCTRGPCAKVESTRVVTTVAPEHPAFPHAMVLTAYGALSSATNSSCHRHQRINGFAEPGRARKTSANLTPATGARTTRFCRPRSAQAFDGLGTRPPKLREGGFSIVRPHAAERSQVKDSPCHSLARTTLPRPPHPIPTFVTMANAPLPGRDGAE